MSMSGLAKRGSWVVHQQQESGIGHFFNVYGHHAVRLHVQTKERQNLGESNVWESEELHNSIRSQY